MGKSSGQLVCLADIAKERSLSIEAEVSRIRPRADSKIVNMKGHSQEF